MMHQNGHPKKNVLSWEHPDWALSCYNFLVSGPGNAPEEVVKKASNKRYSDLGAIGGSSP